MTEIVTDSPAHANPQSTPVIRIIEAPYLDQMHLGGLMIFLPEDLAWDSPLSLALLEKAGHGLDEYILNHVISPRAGDVFTVPKTLWDGPRLFFAVIAKWDDGLGSEERILRKCLRAILQLADNEGIETFGIPALGANRKDIPVRRAARLMLNCIYDHPFVNLKEVQIVCKTSEIADIYRKLSTAI